MITKWETLEMQEFKERIWKLDDKHKIYAIYKGSIDFAKRTMKLKFLIK